MAVIGLVMNARCSLGHAGSENLFVRFVGWRFYDDVRTLGVDLGHDSGKPNVFDVHTSDNGQLSNVQPVVHFDPALTHRHTILWINGTKWRLPSFRMYNFVGPSPSQVPTVFVSSSMEII